MIIHALRRVSLYLSLSLCIINVKYMGIYLLNYLEKIKRGVMNALPTDTSRGVRPSGFIHCERESGWMIPNR